MKLVLTFIFSGILTFTIFSQNGVSFDWANRLGNGFNIWSSNITKDNSGNIYTVGRFSGTMDFDPGPNSSTLNLGGSARDGFIQKLDSNGNFLWVKGFGAQNSTGSSQHVSCSSIAVDDSNNIYVSGGFSSIVDFDPGPGVFNLTPTSTATSYFVKLDSNGQFISARLSENGIRNMVYKNGYLYNFGTFQGTEDFDPGVGTEYLTANIIDTYVQKLDINDSLIWVSSFSGINGGECRLYSQSIDSLDNIYVIGGFSGTVDFDSDNINIANITSFGTNDGYIVKLNNSGDYIWSKNVGRTNSNTELTAITEDLTNVYLIGYFNDTIDADPGLSTFNISPKPNTVGGLSFDAYILKLDSAGNFINVNVIGGAEIDFINSISIDQYSNIYMTGYFSDTVDFDPSPNVYHLISDGAPYQQKLFVLKLDSSNNLVWAKQFEGTSDQYGSHIYTDEISDDIYVVGLFEDTTDFDFGLDTSYLVTAHPLHRDRFILKLKNCTPSTGIDSIIACDSLTWIDGITYTSNNNSAIYTLYNGAIDGCDSIVHLNLTIVHPTYGTDSISTCDSLVWSDGNTYFTNNNTAVDTLINSVGCDSIVTLNLTINNSSSTDNQSACDSLVWIDGITYFIDNTTATHILTNMSGCDSTITLNLVITNIDETVTLSGITLTAVSQTGASYQWLDCNNNYSEITGETANIFTATTNGNYAVEITYNSCIDTSNCMAITEVGLDKTNPFNNINIFPNPTTGLVNLNIDTKENVSLSVYNALGQIVINKENINTENYQFKINGDAGIYTLEITSEGMIKQFQIVKE